MKITEMKPDKYYRLTYPTNPPKYPKEKMIFVIKLYNTTSFNNKYNNLISLIIKGFKQRRRGDFKIYKNETKINLSYHYKYRRIKEITPVEFENEMKIAII